MLNYLWLGLILCGVVLGVLTGRTEALTAATFDACKSSLMTIALPLGAVMALWLGIMRLAEKSGAVERLSGLLRPLLIRLFPDVPADHPAMGAMVMNIAANMLGLGNAATPLGLRAMQGLESLNPRPGTATNAMCTFLAINTSSVQLIPATAVGILAAAGATHPTAIIGTALVATTCSFLTGITSVKLLQRLPMFALPPLEHAVGTILRSTENVVLPSSAPPRPFSLWKKLLLGAYVALFAGTICHLVSSQVSGPSIAITVIQSISLVAIPFLIGFFPLYAALQGVSVYEEFVEGAKEGIQVALRIFPYLVAILVAVGIFRAAGGIDILSRLLAPLLDLIGLPSQVLPMVLVRPMSGSAATGLFAEIVKACGPDSYAAQLAGTILGGTETTLYVLAVYFGSVAIRRGRHALAAGLLADAAGVAASLVICRLVFR
ncbi:MAG: nucleoside recognition protein [Verrucomicrobia bacterium]|jgi:spore maturation protein SpmA|nr:nucleoside recognition protein [Verrucomicrobiota bacterium]